MDERNVERFGRDWLCRRRHHRLKNETKRSRRNYLLYVSV